MPKLDRLSMIAIAMAVIGVVGAFILAPAAQPKSGCSEFILVGHSVNGKPIELCHVGGSHIGAKRSVLIVGSVHGNEPAGIRVVDELVKLGAKSDTDLWVIRNANPDGYALATRQNAAGVDINRNFPTEWLPSEIGTRSYSGSTPASEPETRALMDAISKVHPQTMITIHQPYAMVDCSIGRDDSVSQRLAQLTGLPSSCIPGEWSGSPTNTYTGTISIWVNRRFADSTAVALELGLEVTPEQIKDYALALRQF